MYKTRSPLAVEHLSSGARTGGAGGRGGQSAGLPAWDVGAPCYYKLVTYLAIYSHYIVFNIQSYQLQLTHLEPPVYLKGP